MRKIICRSSLFGIVLFLVLVMCIPMAMALIVDVNEKSYDITGDAVEYTEYLGVTGVWGQRRAPFRILVPHNWNRKLLVYARGTGSGIFLEVNEEGKTVPLQEPTSGMYIVGVTPLTNVAGAYPGDNLPAYTFEAELLEMGFALAASDYKLDERTFEGYLSWIVEDGIRDTLALTLQARRILRFCHGQIPERTILWGRSQGSVVCLKILEDVPWLYDGVITGCTVGAGAPRTWDTDLGFALAFDVAFGWPSDWGSVGDVRDNLTFSGDVLPYLLNLVNENSFFNNLGYFEFIRLVNGLPAEQFYPIPGQNLNWLFADLLFVTEVRADLESKAGGPIVQNIDHFYSLSDNDKEYLLGFGVNAEDLLSRMNERKIEAEEKARLYVKKYAEFSGDISRPVISMHTTTDGLVVPAHESAYRQTVEDAGNGRLLLQVFTDAVGHCTFTQEQWLATILAMESWLDTGKRPDRENKDLFPPTSDTCSGFNYSFNPPDWPQPPPDFN